MNQPPKGRWSIEEALRIGWEEITNTNQPIRKYDALNARYMDNGGWAQKISTENNNYYWDGEPLQGATTDYYRRSGWRIFRWTGRKSGTISSIYSTPLPLP